MKFLEKIRHVLRFEKGEMAILGIFVLIAAGIITMNYFDFDSPADKTGVKFFPGTGEAVKGHLPGMSEERIKGQMQREADESAFSFKINSMPIFEDGNSAGTLRIENPSHNIYPFTVEIFLGESGEKIYDSGGIFPDHHIEKAMLTKALPRGFYRAMAFVSAYDPETKEYRGKVAAELTLIVNS